MGGDSQGNGISKKKLEETYVVEGYKVDFEITSQWNSAWMGLITIENPTDKPIQNWYLKFETNNEISDIWNAEIVNHSEDTYVIRNSLWNHDIKSGEKVEIGFIAKFNDEEIDIPDNFSICNKKMNVSEEAYEIQYTTKDQWDTGFIGEIKIKNISDKVIEDWSLEFVTKNGNILEFYNAIIISSDNGLYEIHNTYSNIHLKPGQTTSIEFTGEKDKATTEAVLEQFKLTQIGYDFDEAPVDELVDLGEVYFKQIQSDDDVLLNEDNGLYYVNNQLLISGVLGESYEFIEKLANEVGASIVGYIELTNDYQIEFNTEMEYNELENMIDYLSSFSFIEDVTLNTVMVVEEDLTTTNDAEYTNETWDEENPDGLNWGAEAIKALSAWDYIDDMQTVKIGLIDSSFYEGHEDLKFTQVWNNTRDIDSTHGSHVAGTMAARFNNKKGIAGISPKNQLYAYATGAGNNKSEMNFATVMEYKYAFALLIGNNVKVINVSQNTGRVQCFAASRGNTNAIEYVNTNAEILGDFLNKLIIKGYNFLIVAAGGNVENLEFVIDNNKTYGYRRAETTDPTSDYISGNVNAFYNSFLNAITQYPVKSRIITVGSFGYSVNDSEETSYHYSGFSNIGDRIDVVAPGEDIYSCLYPAYKQQDEYGNKNGTSMSAPHVAGVAAMIYGVNPSLGGWQVKNILSNMNSSTVKDAHGNSYVILDALASVEKAKDSFGITPPVAPPTGVLMGRVVNSSNNVIKDADVTIYRTSIGDSNLEDYSSSIKTDENGNFEFILEEGNYNLIISKIGYLPVTVNNISIIPDSVEYMESIILTEGIFDFLVSRVKGNVTNALTGDEVVGATIKFRKGWNSTIGNYTKNIFGKVHSVETGIFGEFDISIPIGNYTAEVSKDGFVVGYYNIVSANVDNNYNLVLTPILSEDEYRIVLTWGSTPRDLDSHLTGTLDSEQLFHVCYYSRRYIVDGEIMAELDLDDTSSYGPETVTMTVQADMLENGIYRYSVHDYTNRSSLTSNQLSMSGANVKLYKGNDLIRTINVPINAQGNLWTVFEIENGELKIVNTMSFESRPSNIK